MKNKKSIGAFLLLFIAACAKVDNSAFNSAHQSLRLYDKSVAYYESKAGASEGDESSANQLKAIGRLLDEGMTARAGQKLAHLKRLSPSLSDERNLLEAKRYLLLKHPKRALQKLAKISDKTTLTVPLQVYYYQILSSAYNQTHKPINAVNARLSLDLLLSGSQQQLANHQTIWRLLSSLPLKTETALMMDADEPLRGWLSLNRIPKLYRDDGMGMQQAVALWQQEHQGHPANSLLASSTRLPQVPFAVKKIALLLPLTGPLSGPGRGVRDGFMAAYYQAKGTHPKLKFYDTFGKDVKLLYQQAVSDGSDFVVGPLAKENVKALSGASLGVPVLSLNELSASVSGLYQFGLSPADEVPQVVGKAYANGFRRALLIAPEGAWGEPIAASFISHWQALGGRVTDSLYYGKDDDMDSSIKQLLHITASQSRNNSLVRSLGKKVKFIPRRRQDFDVVFLFAYPSKARQIRPLLRYYYAGGVPIYSTSLIYAGNPNPHADSDLNGVIFADMPWVLKADSHLVHKSWPEQFNSYNRLYAMGKDAYLISQQINQLLLFPSLGLDDNTGRLFMDKTGRIKRELSFARFDKGVPHRLQVPI